MSDVFGPARRFRMLNVIDDDTRECLELIVDTSLSGARVLRELDRCIRLYGRPETIVSDNGAKFSSFATLEWQKNRHRLALYRAGKAPAEWRRRELQRQAPRRMPQRRGVRHSIAHARKVLRRWRHDYNHHRPHSSLGGLTPAARRSLELCRGGLPARSPDLKPWTMKGSDSRKEQGKRGSQVIYSTVTDLARLRGWSTSVPFSTATWYANSCMGTE